MYINFSDIPGHQNLFLDYIQEYENVERFYERNFRDQESYESFFEVLSKVERPNRNKLTKIVKDQYGDSKISKRTLANIDALDSNKTIAVVTGQQLGVLGGPLYTIYKTITAIKLCSYLKDNYEGYNFIPVFWLEGDDHDYDEVRVTNLLSSDNQLLLLKYEDGEPEEFNRGSIAELKFNENISKVFEELNNNLRETEFKNPLIDFYKSFYQSDRTFLECFRELMISLFDEYGLIVFNPVDVEVKKLLQPIYYEEIAYFNNHTGSLVERSAELEEIYHAQVKVKPINLFYIEEGERLLIEPVESEYRLKGKRKKFQKEELLNILNESPEKFSSNVLLRPICQDYLFPTGFYIGGPSEVSYFAQVTPLYKIYNLHQPYIYPRSSVTIVEKGVKSVLEKYELDYSEIFSDEDELISKIVAANSEMNLDSLFQNAKRTISNSITNVGEEIVQIDKTLADLVTKTQQRIDDTLSNLKNKAIDAEKRKHETTIKQIGKVRNVLYPNNNLQERELNFIYFANKYGLDILKWIINETAINKFEHQILELP